MSKATSAVSKSSSKKSSKAVEKAVLAELEINKRTVKQSIKRYIETVGAKTFVGCSHPVNEKTAYVTKAKNSVGTPFLRVRCKIEHKLRCAKSMRKLRKRLSKRAAGRSKKSAVKSAKRGH